MTVLDWEKVCTTKGGIFTTQCLLWGGVDGRTGPRLHETQGLPACVGYLAPNCLTLIHSPSTSLTYSSRVRVGGFWQAQLWYTFPSNFWAVLKCARCHCCEQSFSWHVSWTCSNCILFWRWGLGNNSPSEGNSEAECVGFQSFLKKEIEVPINWWNLQLWYYFYWKFAICFTDQTLYIRWIKQYGEIPLLGRIKIIPA